PDAWAAACRAGVPAAVTAFAPDVLVTQLGCDTHHTDPLAQLLLTTAAYRATAAELHRLAHAAAGGHWVATGGGGYQWARVVPRAWTLYFAEMCGAELPDELPESWMEEAERRLRAEVPATLSEPALGASINDSSSQLRYAYSSNVERRSGSPANSDGSESSRMSSRVPNTSRRSFTARMQASTSSSLRTRDPTHRSRMVSCSSFAARRLSPTFRSYSSSSMGSSVRAGGNRRWRLGSDDGVSAVSSARKSFATCISTSRSFFARFHP